MSVGLSSGLFQSPSYLFPQFVMGIGAAVGASPAQIAWLVPLGFVLPVLVGLLLAAGDWLGGRALVVGLAATTLLGVSLTVLAGVAAAHGPSTFALGLAMAGACLIPAAVRHGALVVAHETRGLSSVEQLSESRSLRQYLVLGIYVIPLPAGYVAGRFGWVWVFALLALLQVGALLVLIRITKGEGRHGRRPSLRAFGRDLAAGFKDRYLVWAAAGAFAAQAAVFAWVGGLPIHLAVQGYSSAVIGVVAFSGVLAVLFVARPRSGSSARFGRWAGAVPIVGMLVVVCSTVLESVRTSGTSTGRATLAVVQLAALGLTSMLIELSKQWSQSIALLQARAGGSQEQDYRRQAVVGLGANLGAVAGAGLGPWSASVGTALWLPVLLAVAGTAWALQASWFANNSRRNEGS